LALDETIGLLARAPIVGLLDRDALRLLAFAADSRRLRRGEIMFRRGDRSDGGYVVVRGRIGLTGIGGDGGGEPDVVAEPGDLIGRVALFVRMQRPATAIALEPAETLRISPTLMHRVLAEFPSAAEVLHAEMAAELAGFVADLGAVGDAMVRGDRS
jgi:CRP-like cAMP-binding protein